MIRRYAEKSTRSTAWYPVFDVGAPDVHRGTESPVLSSPRARGTPTPITNGSSSIARTKRNYPRFAIGTVTIYFNLKCQGKCGIRAQEVLVLQPGKCNRTKFVADHTTSSYVVPCRNFAELSKALRSFREKFEKAPACRCSCPQTSASSERSAHRDDVSSQVTNHNGTLPLPLHTPKWPPSVSSISSGVGWSLIVPHEFDVSGKVMVTPKDGIVRVFSHLSSVGEQPDQNHHQHHRYHQYPDKFSNPSGKQPLCRNRQLCFAKSMRVTASATGLHVQHPKRRRPSTTSPQDTDAHDCVNIL